MSEAAPLFPLNRLLKTPQWRVAFGHNPAVNLQLAFISFCCGCVDIILKIAQFDIEKHTRR